MIRATGSRWLRNAAVAARRRRAQCPGSTLSQPGRSQEFNPAALLLTAAASAPVLAASAYYATGPPCACDGAADDATIRDENSPEEKSDQPQRCNPSWVKAGDSTDAGCWRHRGRTPSSSCSRRETTADGGNGGAFDPAGSTFFEIKLSSPGASPGVSSELSEKPNDGDGVSSSAGLPSSPVAEAAVPADASTQEPLLHNTVVILPDLLTEQECEMIVIDAERILRAKKGKAVKTEKWALFSAFRPDCRRIIERLLRDHVLTFIELRLPEVERRLFRRDDASRSGSGSGSGGEDDIRRPVGDNPPVPKGRPMDFYWDDPVVIKYTAGNRLAPHEDMRELTVIVPLNPLGDFPLEGGGTRFWLEGTTPDEAGSDDGVSIRPSPGSGVIFNGDITHSGNSVYGGTRFVLMTSINLDDFSAGDVE